MPANIKPGSSGHRFKQLRARLALSQRELCATYGFDLVRLRELEQNRAELKVAESALLALAELRPHTLADMLADARRAAPEPLAGL